MTKHLSRLRGMRAGFRLWTPSPLARALALAVLGAQLGLGMAPPALAAGEQPELRRGASVTLNFMNAEIDAVARAVATLTGRNVVVDPRVKGTINLVSTNPVTPGEAVQMFVQQLRTQGFAMVFNNGLYTVVPEAEAKLQTGSVSVGKVRGGGGQIVTQIFKLNHESAANLVPVLRPLISPNNTINVSPSTNALIITDYADNLQRIARIVGTLDVNNATSVEVIKLRHAVASDLAPVVMRLVESGGNGSLPGAAPATGGAPGAQANAAAASPSGADTAYRTTLVPEPRSNSLILRAANPVKAAQVRDLIAKLDQPAESNSGYMGGNIHVVHLKNSDATKLAVTLRAALASLPGANAATSGGAATASVGAAGAGAATGGGLSQQATNVSTSSSGTSISTGPTINAASNNQPATGGQIQADPSTNSLIISAPEPVYRQLRAVIDRLDERRAQVYIEALIAEVSDSLDAEFGVQWQAVLGNAVAIGTNFSNGTSTNLMNLLSAAAGYGANASATNLGNLGSALPGPGANMIGGGSLGHGNYLGALANFLQTSGAGNVLSRPTLLTLDNEEARIVVGQNVPFVTGSYTTTANNSTNPFQTYERQDVGLTLRVRPQISEDGMVKLVIYQEASSLQAGSTTSGYITNKRSIESSVVVDDGSIVVLGGLMQDSYSETEDKVPLLGDVPIVGNLFKSRSRSGSKSNLMVFLRPVVLRDGDQSDEFSQSRYQEMQTHQRASQPVPRISTPVNRSAVLPDLPPKPEVPSSSKLVVDPAHSVTPAPSRQPLMPSPQPAQPAATPDYSRSTGTGPSERYDPTLYVN